MKKTADFSVFNSSTYRQYTNCYTYALDTWIDPITGKMFKSIGCNPGHMSGNPITINDLKESVSAKKTIVEAVKSDCVAWGGSTSDFYEVSENTMVPIGYYKVMLVLNPGRDYHWYRQVSDLSGRWAHKPSMGQATEYDAAGNLIYIPSQADLGSYTEILGYFALKPPSSYVSNTSVSVQSFVEINDTDAEKLSDLYQIKNDLQLEDFLEFFVGVSTKEEVYSKIGMPHSHVGSGYIGDRYFTKDGYDVVIYFYDGKLEQIRTLNSDDSYTIIK